MNEDFNRLIRVTNKNAIELKNIFWCLDRLSDSFNSFVELINFINDEFNINNYQYSIMIYKYWLCYYYSMRDINNDNITYDYLIKEYNLTDNQISTIIKNSNEEFSASKYFDCKEEVFMFLVKRFNIVNVTGISSKAKLILDILAMKEKERRKRVKYGKYNIKFNLGDRKISLVSIKNAEPKDYEKAYKNVVKYIGDFNKNKKPFNIMIDNVK